VECPNCGAEIPERDGRCDECGALLALTYQCPSCGTELNKDDEQCPKCGQEILVEEPSEEPSAPGPKARPKKPAVTGRGRRLPILLVGVVALCCGCLVIAGGLGAVIATSQGVDLGSFFGSWSGQTTASPLEISLTPAPSDVFEVISYNAWIDEKNFLNVAGAVRNIAAQTIETVVVMDVVFFDEEGQQIGTAARASLQRPEIEVDGQSSFWIKASAADFAAARLTDAASCTLDFTLTDTPRTEVELLVIDSTESSEGGSFFVKGDVQNDSGLGVSNVEVYIILYGGGGKVLALFSQDSVVAQQLAPDETASFEVELSQIYGEAESYDILAVGTPLE
jgi:DNA-directed RNA polymerase subunit RPC12/RpoP